MPLDRNHLDTAIVVGLGSNLAGRWSSPQALLEAALLRLEAAGLLCLARSSWWRSSAWPDARDPEFVNGVAIFQSFRSPLEVLSVLNSTEREFGRIRDGDNRPRTLDLDLVAHGRAVLACGDLTLPHPRAHERLFVMGPLAEIAPRWRHPTLGETADALANRASVGIDARPTNACGVAQ